VQDRAFARGLVESYFLKLTEPAGKWAAWIKYTFLVRAGRFAPLGECWMIFFDREAPSGRRLLAAKESFDLQHCRISGEETEIQIGANLLTPGLAMGSLDAGSFSWKLGFRPGGDIGQRPPLGLRSGPAANDHREPSRSGAPFQLLPDLFYSPAIPTTKLTTPFPQALASGRIAVPGREIAFENLPLALGHNWGRKHTDSYVWGQLRAETGAGPLFFEGVSVPAAFGPAEQAGPLPRLTLGRVRLGEREIPFAGPWSWAMNRARMEGGSWQFELKNPGWQLKGVLSLDRELTAGLRYLQPDGAIRCCLNSMLASGRIALEKRHGGSSEPVVEAEVEHTAALEFLTPSLGHGITMLA
jgi:hypothetical protein